MALAKPASLELSGYHLTSLSLRANDEYDPTKNSRGEIAIDFEIHPHLELTHAFMVDLSVAIAAEGYRPEFNEPYSLQFTIRGFFTFDDSMDEASIRSMLSLNGISILYGVARGVVGQATGASTHGQFVLPAVNFKATMSAQQLPHNSAEPPAGEGSRSTARGKGKAKRSRS